MMEETWRSSGSGSFFRNRPPRGPKEFVKPRLVRNPDGIYPKSAWMDPKTVLGEEKQRTLEQVRKYLLCEIRSRCGGISSSRASRIEQDIDVEDSSRELLSVVLTSTDVGHTRQRIRSIVDQAVEVCFVPRANDRKRMDLESTSHVPPIVDSSSLFPSGSDREMIKARHSPSLSQEQILSQLPSRESLFDFWDLPVPLSRDDQMDVSAPRIPSEDSYGFTIDAATNLIEEDRNVPSVEESALYSVQDMATMDRSSSSRSFSGGPSFEGSRGEFVSVPVPLRSESPIFSGAEDDSFSPDVPFSKGHKLVIPSFATSLRQLVLQSEKMRKTASMPHLSASNSDRGSKPSQTPAREIVHPSVDMSREKRSSSLPRSANKPSRSLSFSSFSSPYLNRHESSIHVSSSMGNLHENRDPLSSETRPVRYTSPSRRNAAPNGLASDLRSTLDRVLSPKRLREAPSVSLNLSNFDLSTLKTATNSHQAFDRYVRAIPQPF